LLSAATTLLEALPGRVVHAILGSSGLQTPPALGINWSLPRSLVEALQSYLQPPTPLTNLLSTAAAATLTLAPSALAATSFPSGGYAFAGSSGCQSLGAFDEPARSMSGHFRTAGSGGVVALDGGGQPMRAISSKFFGDVSPADLLDDAKLGEAHFISMQRGSGVG
jgi:hypothetical protein